MAEVANSVISVISDFVLGPIKVTISRAFNPKSKALDLQDELERLRSKMERLRFSIQAAEMNGEEIEAIVKEWLIKADETIKEAELLMQAQEQWNARSFLGCCPDLKRRYQFSKKAEKEAFCVAEIYWRAEFDRISHRPVPLRRVAELDYVSLPSRQQILNEVVDVLKNSDINTVGMCGIAGVGKTTLAKMVCSQEEIYGSFKDVIFVYISNDPIIERIQAAIADQLGLKLDEMSIEVRASRLSHRLEMREKVLVILDDLWRPFNLEDVGISYKSFRKGCKILLISRNQRVLHEMDAQKVFMLETVTDEEAWSLFKMRAGHALENLELLPVAREIVKRCGGLPIALITVATALRNKELFEWKNTLMQLSGGEDDGFLERVNSILRFSYDSLAGKEVQSLFLLCGFLRQSNIWISDLLKYAIGLGFFKDNRTIRDTRSRMYGLIEELKDISFLLDGETNGFVKMYDVVQDFAASIASRDHHMFSVSSDDKLWEWPDKRSLGSCTGISLPCCEISELPQGLECPMLEFLLIHSKNLSLRVPDSFFEWIRELKVLDFSGMCFTVLPSSLVLLKNLCTLCLDHCSLEDVSIIGSLRKLEILTFVGSDIVELPREIGELNKLKLLDLSLCSKLKLIPANVISKLSRLQELYMAKSFDRWEAKELSGPRNASLTELEELLDLTTLEIHVRDPKILPKGLFSKRLESHRILIGEEWEWDTNNEISRMLKLKLNTSIHLEPGLKMLLNGTEELFLDEVKGIQTVLYDLNIDGFPELKHLHVQNSARILYIVDSIDLVSCIAFPILRSMFLENLMNLEKICHGQLAEKSFVNLRILKVKSCNKLKNILSFTLIKGLSKLREMEVIDCENMEEIVADDDLSNDAKNEAAEFTQFCSLTLNRLPKLKSFYSVVKVPPSFHPESGECVSESDHAKSVPLFNRMVCNLEYLKLSSIPCESIWQSQFATVCSRLTSLIIHGCQKLKYAFTPAMIESALKLKKIEICDCEFIEGIIIGTEHIEKERMNKLLFPCLEFLKLQNLPNVSIFCYGYDLIEYPSLKSLLIENCHALHTLVASPPKAEVQVSRKTDKSNVEESLSDEFQSFFDQKVEVPNIEELELSNINHLENIWHSQLAPGSFCKLKTMRIKGCEKLKDVFPSNTLRTFQNIEKLWVCDCLSLQQIYQLEFNGEDTNAKAAFQLTELYLSGLHKLKHVWNKDPRGVFGFHNVQSVNVSDCQALENIFRASIARALPSLKELAISSCGMEEIVAKEEEKEAAPRFVFPQLTTVELQSLPNLRTFYPGKHSLEMPRLKDLKILGCDKVAKFDFEDLSTHGHTPIQQPLFVAAKVFPNLETLALGGNDMIMILEGQLSKEFFYKLNSLELRSLLEESPTSLLSFLQILQHLEKLVVSDSSLKELFGFDGEVNSKEEAASASASASTRALPRIRFLELNGLYNLKTIWKQDAQLNFYLQDVEFLKVQLCGNLINLAPSSACFRNLTSLQVLNCRGLVNLVTSSVAKTMVQLVTMHIEDCDLLTEIVADEENESTEEIILPRLKALTLTGLPNLTSFCLGSHTFQFPSLEQVILTRCPKMKKFTPGVLSTRRLERVLSELPGEEKGRWDGDLNSTIEKMYLDW